MSLLLTLNKFHTFFSVSIADVPSVPNLKNTCAKILPSQFPMNQKILRRSLNQF